MPDWCVISRSEFDRLLQAYADSYAQAVYASVDSREQRDAAIEKVVVAKDALERAVFP